MNKEEIEIKALQRGIVDFVMAHKVQDILIAGLQEENKKLKDEIKSSIG